MISSCWKGLYRLSNKILAGQVELSKLYCKKNDAEFHVGNDLYKPTPNRGYIALFSLTSPDYFLRNGSSHSQTQRYFDSRLAFWFMKVRRKSIVITHQDHQLTRVMYPA